MKLNNLQSYKTIHLALLLSACVGRHALADSITVSESWHDNTWGGVYSSSTDTGTFNAALTVPGLSSMTANDWSNLMVTVNSSSLSTGAFSDTMADAPNYNGSVTASNATIYYQSSDTNGNPVNAFKLTFSKSGNIFTLAGQTLNPPAVQPPWSILASNYLDFTEADSFLINDQASFEVVLQNPVAATNYADIVKTIYISGTNTISYDYDDNELNHVRVTGAADYVTPTLTAVSPTGTLTTTNDLLTVQVQATDGAGVANVEFYLNGLDYGSGVAGVSNLWSADFALLPGLNTIWTQATDAAGNHSTTNFLSVTYVNKQTNANWITFSEQLLDSASADLYGNAFDLDQDVGTLNAAWQIANLKSWSANTWSNLVLSVSFGNLNFSSSLTNANVLTSSNAVFYLNPIADPNGNPLNDEYLSVARAGNTLVLAAQTGNPTYTETNPIIANGYVGLNEGLGGPVRDAQLFGLTLQAGLTPTSYTNISQTVFIAGADTVTNDVNGNELDDVQIAGAAFFAPPALAAVSPAGTLTTTNDLLTVQVQATDAFGVTNVEFYVNGSDYGSGVPGVSNLWSMNFALQPGTNLIRTLATDVAGNNSAFETLSVLYVDRQTNANLITFSEHWLDSSQTDSLGDLFAASQDIGTLNAAWQIANLKSWSANTWSNLVLSVSFGDFSFANSLTAANVLTSSNAVFYLNPIADPNGNPLNDVYLSVARAGNTLVLAAETGNPTYAETYPVIAGGYLGYNGPVLGTQAFALTLQAGLTPTSYTNISQTVFIAGADTVTHDVNGNELDDVQLAGAAFFAPPTLAAVSPAGTLTTTNDLLTMQVKATGAFGVANVEFYVNNQDYGPGVAGASNLWSLNFALQPGLNTIRTLATDVAGNNSTADTLAVTYVNQQTNANLITFSEQLQDSAQTNQSVSSEQYGEVSGVYQDVGTLNAAWQIANLKSYTASTWSNLVLSVSFGNLNFSNRLTNANVLTSSNAVFYLNPIADPNGNPLNDVYLSVARAGNTLVLAAQTGNPTYAQTNPILASDYVGVNGPIQAAPAFALTLQDGLTQTIYTNISQAVFITGTDTIIYQWPGTDSPGPELDNVQLAGAADLIQPTLTAVSPAGTLTTTNDLLTVQVRATDSFGIANVEFYLNGSDYGSGVSGVSNLWSMNFALLPGLNLVQTLATDANGSNSTTTLAVTYVDQQTNASAITFSEHWLDSWQSNSVSGLTGVISQDVGTLNAALPVSGLKSLPASTWSNLVLTVSFGEVAFSNSLAAANVLTSSNALFYVNPIADPNGNPLNDVYLSVARAGNTLVLAAETGNPTYATNSPLMAEYYLGDDGPIQDVQAFALTLQDGATLNDYANVSQTVYISGTDTVSYVIYHAQTNELDNLQMAGSATFMPPTLTVVAPAAGAQLTNGLVTVQARAVENNPAGFGAGNVEFFLNGQDFGSGIPGNSNLWTMNFALAAGSNTIRLVATDWFGNNPATNNLSLVYVNGQTNANLITFTEQWLDTPTLGWFDQGVVASQDTGLLNAALTVSNLQTMSANTWSNLSLTISFGNFSIAQSLLGANVLTPNQAVFYFTNPNDTYVPPANVEQLTVARAGNTLLLAARVGNPTYLLPAGFYFLADNYLDWGGSIQDQQPFALTLQDGSSQALYASVSRPVFIAGSDAVTYDSQGNAFNSVGLAGAADFLPPTSTITAPTANQPWSNALFTVTGTARDNVAVSNVWYSLNSGPWSNAVSANHWTNWSAPVTLTPGVNTLLAYAQDTSGNDSPTNGVSFSYVVFSQLQLRALGLGTWAPNYSNAWLQLGNNYSLTSAPASGFKFSGWTVATNWLGGVVSNRAVLQFNMASNLTLLATFAETNRPTLTLTAPAAGQKMTNALATLVGTASDIWKVAGVWYQVNTNAWNLATTGNGFTNWSQTVTLAAGTNTLKACAQNLGGLFSATNTVSVVSSNAFKLVLNPKPLGAGGWNLNLQLSPGLNGHILVSTNLLNWAALTNFVGTNTSLTLHDPAATNAIRRFYRAVIP